MSPWSSSLPPKLAAAVLRRLPSHADRVRFAAVCRQWRAAAARHPLPPLPWLALPDGTFFSFPCPAALRLPAAAAGYHYHGSCDDWLLFDAAAGDDDGGTDGYLLVNPFTGDTMRLPALSSIRFAIGAGAALAWRGIADDRRAPRAATVRKLALCSGGPLVAAIVGDGRLGKITMCKIAGAGAGSWVMSGHDAWRGITDIAYYDGNVYAVEDTGDLFAMPTGEDPRTGEPTVFWARRVVKSSGPGRRKKQASPPSTRYLLVHGGRLMMVHRTTLTGDDGGETAKFSVFQANLAAARWSEVASVGGDTALFVGMWRSLVRRVAPYGMPGNRIHFLDDDAFPRGCPGCFGSYDMGDGKTYPLLPTLDLCRSNGADETPPATWLFPREQEVTTRWCDLPADVLGLVLRGLSSREDRLYLRVVCRDWCASTRKHLRRRPGALPPPVVTKPLAPATAFVAITPPPAPAVAYLALPKGKIFSFPDLTPRRRDKKFPSAAGYIGAAGDDWLLFHDDVSGGLFRLTSPITGETRLLPSFHGIRTHDWPVELVNEPTAPTSHHLAVTAAAQWPDDDYDTAMSVRKLVICPDTGIGGGLVVAALFGREHFAKVALCSLETFSWSHSTGDRWRWYDDLAFCGSKLFAITARGDLLAFDIGFDGVDTGGAPFVARVESVIDGDCRWNPGPAAAMFHYLVPSGGELLMVKRRFSRAGYDGDTIEVLRADLEERRWEAVMSLGFSGDEALFVSRLCSKAVRGRCFSGDQIFFLPDDCAGMSFWDPRRRQGEHHAAVYKMWAGTVTYLLLRDDYDDGHTMATWLFETPASASTARRGTLKY